MQISGSLRVGEAAPVAARVTRHASGSPLLKGLVIGGPLALIGLAGGAVEEVIWSLAGAPSKDMLIGYAAGCVLGWLFWRPIAMKWLVNRFRKRFVAQGLAAELPMSITLDPERLVYLVGGVEQRAEWSAVTELFRASAYWVFIVQSVAFYAPRRLFPDAAAERAFITAALSYMSDAARKRSGRAEAFVRDAAA
jgi:hypothetical protein